VTQQIGPDGWDFHLLTCSFLISAWTRLFRLRVIPIETLRTNTGILFKIELRKLPFTSLPLHHPLLILLCCLSICLYPPTHLLTYVPTYGSTTLLVLGSFFSFLIYTQSVGLFGQVISPLQGRYLHKEQNAHRHPCLEWDSTPRSQCSNKRRRFMP
jgi:hypothetical protein